MVDQLLPHVRNAAQVLTSQDTPLQVRLIEAGNELWAAMSYPEQWPADLWPKANRIVDRLLEGGSVQTTVAQMDLSAAKDVANEIVDLATEVEVAHSERRHPV